MRKDINDQREEDCSSSPCYAKECFKCGEVYPSENYCFVCEPYPRNAGEQVIWEEWLATGPMETEWNWLHFRTDNSNGRVYTGTRK